MTRFVVVCYDIANPKRLYRVARATEGFGQRVQDSVFECHLDDSRLQELYARIAPLIDSSQDSVRYYFLCATDVARIGVDGGIAVTEDWAYRIT